MSQKNSKIDLSLLWKGALFGIANIIPGVSGGTMAVVTGVYDDFMNAIAHFVKEWKFLFLYILGAGLGIIAGSFTIEALFENWPAPTLFCFMGFILGGLPLLYKKAEFNEKIRFSWIIVFCLSFLIVISMSFFIEPSETEAIQELTVKNGALFFFGGAIAASAMVIPGISGSFLMLLLGLYTSFVTAVTQMNIPFLLLIMAGVGIGILLTARIVGYLLKNHHQTSYAAILGLVLASVIALWPGIPEGWILLLSIICFLAGLTGGYVLGDK